MSNLLHTEDWNLEKNFLSGFTIHESSGKEHDCIFLIDMYTYICMYLLKYENYIRWYA